MISMDKKYRTRDGRPARVLCVDRKGMQPVLALVTTPDGIVEEAYLFQEDGAYTLKPTHRHQLDLIEVSPYEDFKIDEPVMVRDTTDDPWQPRYFAGVNADGEPQAWAGGTTSWTWKQRQGWKFCRRPTEEELAKK